MTEVRTESKTNSDGTKSETKSETKTDASGVTSGTETTQTTTPDGSTGTTITSTENSESQTVAEVKLSSKIVEEAKKSNETIKLPTEVKASKSSNSAPTVKIELPKNAGETKIEIPVDNVNSGTVAIIVHHDGTEEIVKNSIPTKNGVQLTVGSNTTVKIVDNSKDFIDTRSHWAKDAINFVSARGLVNGVSATMYAPNAFTTRAQLWTILARQDGANLTGGTTWYEQAQAWSKVNGISDGSNPNGTITRAQMVTMLWRAVGSPLPQNTVSFTDVTTDAYYAQAVAWAVEHGVTTGTGNSRFSPNDACTRAQIATMLSRYLKNQ